MSHVGQLVKLAIVVMLVNWLESTSIAKALARKNRYELVPNQEIVGLGLSNFAGAIFHSYTTTGSFSRWALPHRLSPLPACMNNTALSLSLSPVAEPVCTAACHLQRLVHSASWRAQPHRWHQSARAMNPVA
jgi:hypothetical protein